MQQYLKLMALCRLWRATLDLANITGALDDCGALEQVKLRILELHNVHTVQCVYGESEAELIFEIERYCIIMLANQLA